MENLAPNCGVEKIPDSESSRQGRRLKITHVDKNVPRRGQLEQVFQFHGSKLFNCLPAKIRNMTKVDLEEFKMSLDHCIESVPDHPKIDGLTPILHKGPPPDRTVWYVVPFIKIRFLGGNLDFLVIVSDLGSCFKICIKNGQNNTTKDQKILKLP